MKLIGPRLDRWIEAITEERAVVFAKRLAGNDTLLTGAHQAGPYLSKAFLFAVLPELEQPGEKNPRVVLPARIESHGDQRKAKAIWYNGKLHGGTRNEVRLTGFGGAESPLLEPENTGALSLFAFTRTSEGPSCSIWLCATLEEEERLDAYVGTVDPGRGVVWKPWAGSIDHRLQTKTACELESSQIPEDWIASFPSGEEVVAKTLQLLSGTNLDPDKRILRRRDCEFAVFRSVEQAITLPRIKEGFQTMDAFVKEAQTLLQRRKSRSGRSLELHVKAILDEEGLKAGRDFEYNVESDKGRRPDFLFPSQRAYRDSAFPPDRLAMLATKTTCRDRWRQVLNEAERIPTKHLLTLQEGITERQFEEMTKSGIQLVVPKPLHKKFKETIRTKICSIRDFIESRSPTKVRSS